MDRSRRSLTPQERELKNQQRLEQQRERERRAQELAEREKNLSETFLKKWGESGLSEGEDFTHFAKKVKALGNMGSQPFPSNASTHKTYSNYVFKAYQVSKDDRHATMFANWFEQTAGFSLAELSQDPRRDLRGNELKEYNHKIELERQKQADEAAANSARIERANFLGGLEIDVREYNQQVAESGKLLNKLKKLAEVKTDAINDGILTPESEREFRTALVQQLKQNFLEYSQNLLNRFELAGFGKSLATRSQSTRDQYDAINKKMIEKVRSQNLNYFPLVHDIDGKAMSKSQARINKAAFNTYVYDALNNMDLGAKTSLKDFAKQHKVVIEVIRNTYEKFPYALPYAPKGFANPVEYSTIEVSDSRDLTQARRLNLQNMPPQWADMLIEALPRSQQMYGYIASTFGCRPQEMVNGVVLTDNGDTLECKIETIKRKKEHEDLRFRIIEVDKTHPHAQRILRDMRGAKEIVYANSGYQRAINRAVKNLGFDAATSSYSFRHQFVVNAIKSGITSNDVSTCVGHISRDTLAHYYNAGVRPTDCPPVVSVRTSAA